MPNASRHLSLAVLTASLFFTNPARATEASYGCDGGVTLHARFSPPGVQHGRVTLTFDDGSTLTLPQVMSADGGRYAANGIVFWIKGRDATLTRGCVSSNCTGLPVTNRH